MCPMVRKKLSKLRIRRVDDQKPKAAKKTDGRKTVGGKPVLRRSVPKQSESRSESKKPDVKGAIKSTPSKSTTQFRSPPPRKPSPPTVALAIRAVPPVPDSLEIESAALSEVNKTLAEIESFLAKWESSRVKPDHMKTQVEKIKKLHSALTSWQIGALRAKRGKPDAASAEKRVKVLTRILEK